MTEDTSSNHKEATNLVMYLKRLLLAGVVKRGSELFLFTDNEVAERTYFRGSSQSSRLHQNNFGITEDGIEWKIDHTLHLDFWKAHDRSGYGWGISSGTIKWSDGQTKN